MVAPVKQLIEQAMQLPPEDRRRLVEVLWESLDDEPLSPEWAAEIERRIADLDSGRTQAVPMDEALARIREKLHARRQRS